MAEDSLDFPPFPFFEHVTCTEGEDRAENDRERRVQRVGKVTQPPEPIDTREIGAQDGGGEDHPESEREQVDDEADEHPQQQDHQLCRCVGLDLHVPVLKDRAHGVGLDPIAVVLVVEHAAWPELRAEARVVDEIDRL